MTKVQNRFVPVLQLFHTRELLEVRYPDQIKIRKTSRLCIFILYLYHLYHLYHLCHMEHMTVTRVL
jgi:hypothetical protein